MLLTQTFSDTNYSLILNLVVKPYHKRHNSQQVISDGVKKDYPMMQSELYSILCMLLCNDVYTNNIFLTVSMLPLTPHHPTFPYVITTSISTHNFTSFWTPFSFSTASVGKDPACDVSHCSSSTSPLKTCRNPAI